MVDRFGKWNLVKLFQPQQIMMLKENFKILSLTHLDPAILEMATANTQKHVIWIEE